MKKLLFILFSVMFSLSVFSQTKNPKEFIEGYYYSCEMGEEDTFNQKGMYLYENGKLYKHGEWKMFRGKDLVSRGIFEYDKIVHLEIMVEGQWRKVTRRDFEFIRKTRNWSTQNTGVLSMN